MANDKIDKVHLENYQREMRNLNRFTLQPIPPPMDARLWSGTSSSLVTHLSEVQSFARNVKSVLRSYPINNETDFQNFDGLCRNAAANSVWVQNYWVNRRVKLVHALNASIFWSHWNNNIREFFLTGLVKGRRDEFISVPYGDDQKNINGHSYLNGLFAGTTDDLLYGSDGDDDVTSAGEAANELVRTALDASRVKVREIARICKENIRNCEDTYHEINAHLNRHNEADSALNDLRTEIENIKSQKTVSYEHSVGDQEGGPGS